MRRFVYKINGKTVCTGDAGSSGTKYIEFDPEIPSEQAMTVAKQIASGSLSVDYLEGESWQAGYNGDPLPQGGDGEEYSRGIRDRLSV